MATKEKVQFLIEKKKELLVTTAMLVRTMNMYKLKLLENNKNKYRKTRIVVERQRKRTQNYYIKSFFFS